MKSSVHLAASAAGAGLLWAATGSWAAALWSCAGGWLLDLDHVPEYLAARPQRISAEDFFAFWRTFNEPRVYLWLHAWEWVPLLGAAWLLGWAPAATGGLAFGLLHHLILDQFGNCVRPAGYSLLQRLRSGFKSEYVLLNANCNKACGEKRNGTR